MKKSDLISRRMAINALRELDMLKDSRRFDSNPRDWIIRMFLEAENTIKALPSAERTAKVGQDDWNVWLCGNCQG